MFLTIFNVNVNESRREVLIFFKTTVYGQQSESEFSVQFLIKKCLFFIIFIFIFADICEFYKVEKY